MQLVMITGMSGAGKSRAMAALEDLGYYCVDNLPPRMAGMFTEQYAADFGLEKVAIAVDARSGALLSDMSQLMTQFRLLQEQNKITFSMLFLDCGDDVLLDRYKETRRRHPLLSEEQPLLSKAVETERQLLCPLRERADVVLDTTKLSVNQLRSAIVELFQREYNQEMLINCMSFGFKYGAPAEADLVFDVRCLPNPFYIADLRDKTGLDKAVRDYVLSTCEGQTLLEKLKDLLSFLIPLYEKEGKTQLTMAFGCTGGKHRSITFAYVLREYLQKAGHRTVEIHRDLNRHG